MWIDVFCTMLSTSVMVQPKVSLNIVTQLIELRPYSVLSSQYSHHTRSVQESYTFAPSTVNSNRARDIMRGPQVSVLC
jgi:hypothetical protein